MSSIEFDKVRLFNELQRWSLEDLQTLCFYLELGQPSLALSYDKLAGQTSPEKARSLIRHLQKYEGFQSWAHLRHTVEEHFTFMDATFLPELTQTPPPQLARKPDRPERVPDPKPAIQERMRQMPIWGWAAGGGVLAVIALLVMWPWSETPPNPTPTATQLTVTGIDEPNPRSMQEFIPSPTPTLDPNVPPPNPAPGKEWPRPVDGMVMVFVPGGIFTMGTEGYSDEQLREVTLEGFWIDKYEVTNAQYQLCVKDGVCEPSRYADSPNFNEYNYPVVGVSWRNAVAYAEWVGAELPTEEQWEYASRGEERRIYPWRNEFDGTRLNCDSTSCPNDGYEYTAPVGSYLQGASWVGALDMAGNVWEWTSSPYNSDAFVLRGGSWNNSQFNVRASNRDRGNPDYRNFDVGFRLVLPIFLSPDQPLMAEVDEPTPTVTLDPNNVPPPNPELGGEWTRPVDGMVMVFVPPPSQPFELGSGLGAPTEGYWIDKYEVTNAQYQLCVDDRACLPSSLGNNSTYNGVNYPVVGVSWHNAVAYAEWVGAELPTEEQWEYAAGGEERHIYPWGDEFDGTRLNCGSTDCPNDGYQHTAPVGSYPKGASWVGALDMAGNVWEWTNSPYDSNTFVLRGGSWYFDLNDVRVSYRLMSDPDNWNYVIGFRLVSPIFLSPER